MLRTAIVIWLSCLALGFLVGLGKKLFFWNDKLWLWAKPKLHDYLWVSIEPSQGRWGIFAFVYAWAFFFFSLFLAIKPPTGEAVMWWQWVVLGIGFILLIVGTSFSMFCLRNSAREGFDETLINIGKTLKTVNINLEKMTVILEDIQRRIK
jgi:hypothetical protein